ncbi:MAG: hypothetical protein WD076_04770 [Parvularculaceae bacterium]
MKLQMIGLAAMGALAGCGQSADTNAEEGAINSPAHAEAPPESQQPARLAETAPASSSITDIERAAAIAALNMPAGEAGQVINSCDEAVTPEVFAADLGGAVGRAFLVVVGGGPMTAACYGDTGMQFYLFNEGEAGLHLVLSDFGHFAVMDTEHFGVRDVAIGGPGFEFPVLEWNGEGFVPSRTIKDVEFPTPLN